MGNVTGTSGEAFPRAGSSGFETLGIDGVGLIGGSIAAAAKARSLCRRVLGFGRSAERLEAARDAGLIDDFSLDYRAASEVDLQICCLPVDRIPEAILQAAACMQPGGVVTDAGSVKGSICESIGSEPAPGVFFVGSHPLAGSEKQGFAHADADLFAGRTCVVTPGPGSDESATVRVTDYWQRLGSSVLVLSPAEHDRILARTSHMPHAVAAAVAAALCPADITFAASGFRDTTRIAAGDPALWTSILYANRVAVASELRSLVDRCQQFVSALESGQVEAVEHLLADGKRCRDAVGTNSV